MHGINCQGVGGNAFSKVTAFAEKKSQLESDENNIFNNNLAKISVHLFVYTSL